MRLSVVRAYVIEAATAADLAAAINAFTRSAGPDTREFLDIQFEFDGATYTALILYAE